MRLKITIYTRQDHRKAAYLIPHQNSIPSDDLRATFNAFLRVTSTSLPRQNNVTPQNCLLFEVFVLTAYEYHEQVYPKRDLVWFS